MQLPRADTAEAVPDRYLEKILHYSMSWKNDTTVDFSRPQVRPSIAGIYPLFVFIYGLLIVTGSAMNFAMAHRIFKDKLYKEPTHAFLVNIVVANIIKCIFALPITLAVLTIQNWIFGKFMCFFLPMLQDIPFHVSTISHLMIAGDRFRMLRDPGKPRMPAFVCSLGSWFYAVCIAIPYPVYTTYVDMEASVSPHLKGLGICIANLDDDMQEYARGLLIGTYVAPLTFTAYLYVRASRELQRQGESAHGLAMDEVHTRVSADCRGSNENVGGTARKARNAAEEEALRTGTGSRAFGADARPSPTSATHDFELDTTKEKRAHKYLVLMVSTFAACLCPVMVLRLAKLALVETYENSGRLDATYSTLVWFAFVPTVTTPSIFAFWHMSRSTKVRLRGYLRSSARDRRSTTTLRSKCESSTRTRASIVVSRHYGRTESPAESTGETSTDDESQRVADNSSVPTQSATIMGSAETFARR